MIELHIADITPEEIRQLRPIIFGSQFSRKVQIQTRIEDSDYVITIKSILAQRFFKEVLWEVFQVIQSRRITVKIW